MDDSTLLERYAREHIEAAFAEVVARHIDAVYSAALRRVGGDTHLAEDVTQQVFVAMAAKARALSQHPVLSAWLHQATRHQAANAVRSERRRKAREQEALAMELNSPEPATDVEWRRLAPLLDAAIDQLSSTDRAAVALRFLEGRSYPEVAAVLRVSEDAARRRVERALDKLRAGLKRSGIASTPAALAEVLAANAVTAAPSGLAGSVIAAAAAGGAVAAGSATVLATLIDFMTTTKAMGVAVAVLAAGAVGTLTYRTLEYREAGNAVRAEKLGMRRQTTFRVQREAAAERAVQAFRSLQQRFVRAAAQYRDPKEFAQRAGYPPGAIDAGRRFLERHPELGQTVTDYCRAQVRRNWEPALRRRQLTQRQIDQMIEYQLTAPQNAMVLNIGGRPIEGPDGETMVLVAPGSLDEERRKTLSQDLVTWGGAGIAREVLRELALKSNEQSLGLNTAHALAQGLYHGPEPLRADQAEKIAALIAANIRVADRFYDGDTVLEGAKTILSPRQLAFMELLNARIVFEGAITRTIENGSRSGSSQTGGGR